MAKPHRFDVELIRQAASGRWSEILSTVGGLPGDALDGRHHACPWCGGKDRFRLIDQVAGACLCNQCFRTKNGDGLAVLQKARGWTFQQAAGELAKYLGVQTNGKQSHRAYPAEHLEWLPWSELLIGLWCEKKPPIKPDAVKAVGGRLARYRGQWTVIALPVWGQQLDKSDPVGWCLYNVSGGMLPKFAKGKPVGQVKVKMTYGSRPGVIGTPGTAGTVWKTEGPSDLLALLSVGIPDGVSAICNAHGAGEDPAKVQWLVEMLRDRSVYVVHDCDQPGQAGAIGDKRPGWATAIAAAAAECRNVVLPFEIAETHGKDLRDWLAAGHVYQELMDLAAVSPVIPRAGQVSVKPLEADDDPHRLARMNLERYATAHGGRTLRYWRDEWYVWKRHRYSKITDKELRAKVSLAVKHEFDRINVEQQQSESAGDEEPKQVRKVTTHLVGSVLQATASVVVLSSEIDVNTWLPTRERRRLITMANGIVDLDAVLADQELSDCVRPHTPNWFSMVALPYEFNPEATCPKWDAFLRHNLEGDQERIAVLQEWAGYCLVSDTGQQKFLVMEGEGANGKSVYMSGLTAMLGEDNVSGVPLEVFGDRFARTDTLGRLLNAAGDCGDVDKVAEGYIKTFTGGDRMFFDRKGLPGLTVCPTARLMISCNNRPRLSDKSDGVWRRMLLIPWLIQIPEEQRIRGMDRATWWNESGELPGLFNWAVAGLHRLRTQGGFSRCRAMEEAIADYQEEMSPTRSFLADNVEENAASSIQSSVIYAIYRKWCQEHGYHPLADRSFGKELRRIFRKAHRRRGGARESRFWFYEGICFSKTEICGEKVDKNVLF